MPEPITLNYQLTRFLAVAQVPDLSRTAATIK